MKVQVNVNNVPNYAKSPNTDGFMVARLVDGQLWFYGLYDTFKRATEVSEKIEGLVIERKRDEC